MSQSFAETMERLAATVKESEKGKKKKTFSQSDFEKLFLAFLNENDYTTEVVKSKGGELVKLPIQPVNEFRRTFHAVLLDYGVDKEQAQSMLDGSYQFRKVYGAYEFVSEVLTSYLESKTFTFIPKEDFRAVLSIDEIDEVTKEFRVPTGEGEEPRSVKKKVKKHKKMKVKSGAPSWSKIQID